MSDANSQSGTLTYSRAVSDLGSGLATFAKGTVELTTLAAIGCAHLLAAGTARGAHAIRVSGPKLAKVRELPQTTRRIAASPRTKYGVIGVGAAAVVAGGAIAFVKLRNRKPKRPNLELVVNDEPQLSTG